MKKGMLTRKQLWLRCKKKPLLKTQQELYTSEKIPILSEEKKVKFHNSVSVILIPEIPEYKKYQLHKNIWYSFDDFELFRRDVINEYKKKNNSF